MANQLSNLRELDQSQFNALHLQSVPRVSSTPTGNVEGVHVVFNGATSDGRNIGLTINYPAGFKSTTALSGDSRAIDVDMNPDTTSPAFTKYFEVSIDSVNVFMSSWTVDVDVQMGSGNPTTVGTWQFVKSVVVDDKVKSR